MKYKFLKSHFYQPRHITLYNKTSLSDFETIYGTFSLGANDISTIFYCHTTADPKSESISFNRTEYIIYLSKNKEYAYVAKYHPVYCINLTNIVIEQHIVADLLFQLFCYMICD